MESLKVNLHRPWPLHDRTAGVTLTVLVKPNSKDSADLAALDAAKAMVKQASALSSLLTLQDGRIGAYMLMCACIHICVCIRECACKCECGRIHVCTARGLTPEQTPSCPSLYRPRPASTRAFARCFALTPQRPRP